MRRFVRLLVAGAAAVALLLLGAGPATAGGPTSVILVGPSERQAAALYVSDADYAVLGAALEAKPEQDPEGPPPNRGQPGGTHINATWLIHDISIWRIDHIFVTASGGPWIQTHLGSMGEPPAAYGDGGTWHRSPHPDQLLALLGRAGFTVPGPAAESEPAAAAEMPASPGSVLGLPPVSVWWVPVVLAVGAALGLLGRPAVGAVRERIRARGPRRELIG